MGSSTENKSIRNQPLFAAGNLTHHLYLGTWHKAFGAGETFPGANSMRKIVIVGGGQSGLQLGL
ncbi:MAG: hypothetical protein DMC60_13940, partial [Verrucomicrobia bacterium]